MENDLAPVDFYQPHNYQTRDSVGFMMKRIVVGLSCSIERRLAADDLTHAQWSPLFAIAEGRGRTVAELARECFSDAGAMTRMLDRLEAKGLLRRERSSQDRRVINLQLTDEGRAIAARVPQVLSEALNEHLSGFSHDEWLALRGYLERMVGTAERLKERAGCLAPVDA